MALDAVTEFLRKLYEKQVKTILKKSELAASAKTTLKECELVDLQFVKTFALTFKARFHASATGDLRLHILTSPHGGSWDTEDFATTDLTCVAGEQAQKTALVEPNMRYVKVQVENLDTSYPAYDIEVTATY